MGGTEEEISGVDTAEGTPGVDNNATPGVEDEVDHEATLRVDDDAPDDANKSDKTKIEQTNAERTSSKMNLRQQLRKEYNQTTYNNVFDITDKT